MDADMENKIYKVVIVGSGPSGYTAAIYAARANLDPLMFEGFYSGPAGGQLMTTTEVENFPGFPLGITGPQLMEDLKKQAQRFGTDCVLEDVESIDLSSQPYTVKTSKKEVKAHAIIIATGATARKLDIKGAGEDGFWQKGVTACAVCDGAMPIFRDKPLFVIGGGDSAVEEAIFLTKFGSKVIIVHRRDELRASKIMAERALNHPKVEIMWDSVLEEVMGDNVVNKVRVKNVKSSEITEHEAGGVFFAIGHEPNTEFLNGQLEKDEAGYLLVKPGTTKTNVEGVFAAGDVMDPHYRQAITAAGSGCMAALDAERWLSSKGLV